MTGDIQRYRDNLRDELSGAALYAALAAAEADPRHRFPPELLKNIAPLGALVEAVAAADENPHPRIG
jgi:hypothetical protein